MVAGLERRVSVRPAWDRRSPDPHTNYGVHGAEILFALVGEHGAVTFVVFTNWMLPHIPPSHDHGLCQPMGASVDYHSRFPHYEGHSVTRTDCEYTGGVCYSDGSGLAAVDLLARLISEGDGAMWAELEEWYERQVMGPCGDGEGI